MKLIKRVKNGAFLYQTTLVPRAPRISRTLCRHATFSKVAWWLSHSRWLIKTFLVLSVQFLLYITFDSNYSHFLNVKSAASKFFEKREIFKSLFSTLFLLKFFISLFFSLVQQCTISVLSSQGGAFLLKMTNVWCGIAWLEESWFSNVRDRSRPLRLSPSG